MEPAVIFFDDICVLCSRSVHFIIRNDPRGFFSFASMDSPTFSEKVQQYCAGMDKVDSVVLFMDGICHTKSSAVLKIIRHLRFPWPILLIGYIIPRAIRDYLYDLIARNRYRWFGKRDTCFLPAEHDRYRFLD